jgi:hypothetical protein
MELFSTLEELIAGANVDEVLMFAPLLDAANIDVDGLRRFLVDNRGALDSKRAFASTQWAKCVCLYGLLRYEHPNLEEGLDGGLGSRRCAVPAGSVAGFWRAGQPRVSPLASGRVCGPRLVACAVRVRLALKTRPPGS